MLTQFVRCAVIKDTGHRNLERIDKNNVKKLSGRYENWPAEAEGVLEGSADDNTFSPISLWEQLDYTRGTSKKSTVDIEFESKKRATARLYENDSLISTVVLNGRVRKGYFYESPFFIALPFLSGVFGYGTDRYRLSLSDNSLVVDYRWNYHVFVLSAGSNKGRSHEVFKRIESQTEEQ